MITALYSQCEILYSIPDTEHDGVWCGVVETAVEITLAQDRQQQQEREA